MKKKFLFKTVSIMLASSLALAVPFQAQAAWHDQSSNLPDTQSKSDALKPALIMVGVAAAALLIYHFSAKKEAQQEQSLSPSAMLPKDGAGYKTEKTATRRTVDHGQPPAVKPHRIPAQRVTVHPYLDLGVTPTPGGLMKASLKKNDPYWRVGISVNY